MSYIDAQLLSVAYYRHDDREMWDVEWPIGPRSQVGAGRRYRNIARATRNQESAVASQFWPRATMFGDETLGDCTVMPPPRHDDRVDMTGNSGHPYRIRGYALDSGAGGVGGAVMDLFRTADDVKVETAVSVGPSGQYDLGTDDTVTQHYIVAYRTGPDILGTTVNTLVGAAD